MTMYAGGDARHLRDALRSVYTQTLVPDQVIVVEDGPLTAEQSAVLDEFADATPIPLRIRLEENLGSGPAAARGLAAVSHPWCARVDADDICVPDRFERQFVRLRAEADAGRPVDVLGSAMTEFDGARADAGHPLAECATAVRRLPADHDGIARYARVNNPVNHPTVVFRTELARTVGGYGDLLFMEDYDLMARLLAGGARFANLAEPLVWFRTSAAMFRRRSDRRLLRSEWRMQRNLREYGLISRPRAALNLVIRVAYRLLPAPVLRVAHAALFHRRDT